MPVFESTDEGSFGDCETTPVKGRDEYGTPGARAHHCANHPASFGSFLRRRSSSRIGWSSLSIISVQAVAFADGKKRLFSFPAASNRRDKLGGSLLRSFFVGLGAPSQAHPIVSTTFPS